MKKLLMIIICLVSLNCGGNSATSDCNECGGGLIDGFLYKEVTSEDLASLIQIDVTADLGACIRFKLDGEEMSEATVVDDCCCVEY